MPAAASAVPAVAPWMNERLVVLLILVVIIVLLCFYLLFLCLHSPAISQDRSLSLPTRDSIILC